MPHIDPSPRIHSHVIADYLRVNVEPVFRKRVLLQELQSHGRVTTGHGGEYIEWRPRYKRNVIVAGEGNPVGIDFPRMNDRMIAKLYWRQYQLGQSITKMEVLASQNKDTALFNIVEQCLKHGIEDFREGLCDELYIDSSASGNSKKLSGFETWYAVNGVVSDSKAGDPNDEYAQLHTNLGYYSGSWTPNSSDGWPTGTGKPQYHFWSPLVVDYTNTGWSATTKTWPNTWQEAIGYLLTYGQILQKQDYDVLLLNPTLLEEAKRSLESDQRFILSAEPGTTDIGPKYLRFEGMRIATEYGIPDAVGYAYSWDNLELMSMQDDLIEQAEDTDITTSTRLIALDAYIQLKCLSPAYTGKLQAIS